VPRARVGSDAGCLFELRDAVRLALDRLLLRLDRLDEDGHEVGVVHAEGIGRLFAVNDQVGDDLLDVLSDEADVRPLIRARLPVEGHRPQLQEVVQTVLQIGHVLLLPSIRGLDGAVDRPDGCPPMQRIAQREAVVALRRYLAGLDVAGVEKPHPENAEVIIVEVEGVEVDAPAAQVHGRERPLGRVAYPPLQSVVRRSIDVVRVQLNAMG
jgi:hypothetical protein